MAQVPTHNALTILVVDDDEGTRELLRDALRMNGYTAIVASDGQKALTEIRNQKIDLVIADINMPRMDGFTMLEKMRAADDQTPVLMLSARNDRDDISHGLRTGADDYLVKPFGLEELILRVAAILRRSGKSTDSHVILHCGPISLDDSHHEVKFHEEIVELSPTEYRLLQFLMERPGRVITKETLLASVWDIDFANNSTVVDTYISYLRKKLHRDGFEGIKTIRGVGFQLLGKE
ncbi:MAG: response regulator transcription factor [Actinomycetes bacterium]